MNKRVFSQIILLGVICGFAQEAKSQVELPDFGNEVFRNLEKLIDAEFATSPPSETPPDTPLKQMPPEEIWKMAEEGLLLHNGFPTFSQHTTLASLMRFIDSHPKKSKFIDLMLEKVVTTSLPTREPNGWNEIAIISHGGTAGLLISGVTRLAQPTDCQKIIETIVGTNDAAKISKLHEAIKVAPAKEEFEKILKQIGSNSEVEEKNTTKLNSSLSPSLLPDSSKNTSTASPLKELATKKLPEAKSASISNEKPSSSTPWSIIMVLIVAACGLLWLLLKRRS